jgi:hypothetical protein
MNLLGDNYKTIIRRNPEITGRYARHKAFYMMAMKGPQ